MNHDNLKQAYDANQQAAAVVQRQAADRKQFLAVISEGRPWNEHVVAQEASQFLVATSQNYLEVCRRVAWAKLMSPSTAHWLAWCQDKVGITSRRQAYAANRVAEKLLGNGAPADNLLRVQQSKLVELTAFLDPEELEVLGEDEEVEGLGALDELEKLSRRELRKRLRDRQDELDREKKKLVARDDEVGELKKKVGELTLGTTERREQLKRLGAVQTDFMMASARFAKLTEDIDWDGAHAEVRAMAAGALATLEKHLHELRALLDLHAGLEPGLYVATGTVVSGAAGLSQGRADAGQDAPGTTSRPARPLQPLTTDADNLLNDLLMNEVGEPPRQLEYGMTFSVADVVFADMGWTSRKLAEVLPELVQHRVLKETSNPSVYAWVYRAPEYKRPGAQDANDLVDDLAFDDGAQVIDITSNRTDG